MKKMTPWFPPHIKPVYEGVYEVDNGYRLPRTLPTYARWDGLEWSNASYRTHLFYHPELHYTSYGAYQNKTWRGFTKEQT
jgi:hypothetical protein